MACVSPAPADVVSLPEEGDRFFAFDVLHRTEAERLLVESAAVGFRLVDIRGGFRTGWTSGGYAALMERSEDGESPTDYRVLVYTHIERLEEGLNEAAADGFRLVPHGLFFQQRGAAPFQDPEYVAIVARYPGPPVPRHYLVPEGEHLLSSIRVALQRGYEIAGFTAGPESAVAVMEIYFRGDRPDGGLPPADLFRVVEAGRVSTLRKRLGGAAEDGYRLSGLAVAAGRFVALLRRDSAGPVAEYLIPQPRTLLDEIGPAGLEGYRLLSGTLAAVAVLERTAGVSMSYEYGAVGVPDRQTEEEDEEDPWKRESKAMKQGRSPEDPDQWLRELESRVRLGWSVRGLLGPTSALLERPAGYRPGAAGSSGFTDSSD